MSRPTSSLANAKSIGDDGLMSTWTRKVTVAVIALAALVLPGCSHTISGTATTKLTPLDAALDGATPADRVPHDSPLEGFLPHGGQIRTRESPPVASMEEAVQNTVGFWRTKQHLPLAVRVEPTAAPITCATSARPGAHAAFCDGSVIRYDAAWADALLADPPYGAVALEIVAAHEVGHVVLHHLGFGGDLDRSPRVGIMNANEVSADCLSGVYMKSTSTPVGDLDQALPLTALGGNVVREQAFHDGLSETNPQRCIDRYLG